MTTDESIKDFLAALSEHAPRFGIQLGEDARARLGDYYRIVGQWNARLHLVAPCSAAAFATRHVLESLTALPFLSEAARVADVGSGGGLPSIPCLIARPDIRVTLIEASQKKAVFLREALRAVGATERAQVIAKRFEETPAMPVEFVTCRAIERFAEKFQKLVEWSPQGSSLLFFGGPAIQEEIEKAGLSYQSLLIPESERRFLFIIKQQVSS